MRSTIVCFVCLDVQGYDGCLYESLRMQENVDNGCCCSIVTPSALSFVHFDAIMVQVYFKLQNAKV